MFPLFFGCSDEGSAAQCRRRHQQRKHQTLIFWRDGLERQLAAINAQMAKVGLASRQPSELLDQRDRLLRQLSELRRHIEANADDVGDAFAEEARKIHYGEAERRNIYGQASDEDAASLAEEGVEFARIPWVRRADS